MSTPGVRTGLATILCSLVVLHAGTASPQEAAPQSLGWLGGVSDVPLVELGGTWIFDPRRSDPMVEEWGDGEIIYVIQQFPDRIVFDFQPEGGGHNLQGYRWDGSVSEFQRGGAEVRERARWVDAGRAFEVEGRWWIEDEPDEVTSYTFHYSLDGPDVLVFVQSNPSGSTTWRFRRR